MRSTAKMGYLIESRHITPFAHHTNLQKREQFDNHTHVSMDRTLKDCKVLDLLHISTLTKTQI